MNWYILFSKFGDIPGFLGNLPFKIWKGKTKVAGVYVKNSPKLSASDWIKLTKEPSDTLLKGEILKSLSYIKTSNCEINL